MIGEPGESTSRSIARNDVIARSAKNMQLLQLLLHLASVTIRNYRRFFMDSTLALNDAEFDLDVSIVERGDAVNALLCSTDNGCDTVKGSDC